MGAFGENFPYSNFHNMNMDWVIQVIKEFKEEYSGISETIDNGITELENKAVEIEQSLDTQLATATEAFSTTARTIGSEVIESIPEDYTDLYNIVLGLFYNKREISWTQGYYIATDTGSTTADNNYAYSELLPKGTLKYLINWNQSDSIHYYISLYNNGNYVGYLVNDYTTAITYDSYRLNFYMPHDTDFQQNIYIENIATLHNSVTEMLNSPNTSLIFTEGVWGITSGEFESSNTYLASQKLPREYHELLNNWNYNSGYSFIVYYENSVFKGTRYLNQWHDTTNTHIVFPFEYDEFALCVYKPDITCNNVKLNTNIELAKQPTPYVINVGSVPELMNALDFARENEDKGKIFDIYLAEGTYDIWNFLDRSTLTNGDVPYSRGLELPNNCNLIGIGNCVLSCSIPEADNSAEHPYTLIVSTLNTHGTNNKIKNIHFIGTNTRYCVHDDSGFDNEFAEITFEYCKFTHNGTASDLYMPDPRCYGAGYTTGRKANFIGCEFVANGNCNVELYAHTHVAPYDKSDPYLVINNCRFMTINKTAIDYQTVTGTIHTGIVLVNNNFLNTGCSILMRDGSGAILQGAGNGGLSISNLNNSAIFLN